MVPIVVADGGAGLVVGAHVGQLEGEAERLAGAGGPDAARQVELASHHVLPDALQRVGVSLFAGEGRHVGHARVHVRGAHRVADRLVLVHHFLVRLVVRAAGPFRAVRSALVQHEPGQAQVAGIAGHPVELDEPHLGDLVPRPDGLLAGTERAVEQLGRPEGHVQQGSLARRLVVRDRGLVEMAEVVELVAVYLLPLPPPLSRPPVRVLGINGAGRVEVTVRLLGRGDLRDEAVQVGFQPGVRTNAERVGGALDHLVEVRVVEGVARRRLVREGLAAEGGRGALEVVDALALLALLEGEGNAHRPVGLDARQPERVREVHRRERHRSHRVVAGCGPGRGGGGEADGRGGDPASKVLHELTSRQRWRRRYTPERRVEQLHRHDRCPT